MSQAFLPGDETWYAIDSPTTSFSAVFEDDGETGYFYAYDRAGKNGQGQILDACHIYNVRSVRDREVESEVEVIWTPDGLCAALLINDYPHAVLDFARHRGYCRSNFPPPTGPLGAEGQERLAWSDDLLAPFTA